MSLCPVELFKPRNITSERSIALQPTLIRCLEWLIALEGAKCTRTQGSANTNEECGGSKEKKRNIAGWPTTGLKEVANGQECEVSQEGLCDKLWWRSWIIGVTMAKIVGLEFLSWFREYCFQRNESMQAGDTEEEGSRATANHEVYGRHDQEGNGKRRRGCAKTDGGSVNCLLLIVKLMASSRMGLPEWQGRAQWNDSTTGCIRRGKGGRRGGRRGRMEGRGQEEEQQEPFLGRMMSSGQLGGEKIWRKMPSL